MKLNDGAEVSRGLPSNGCIVYDTVVNSVLSPGVVVEAGAEVRDSIILNDTVVEAGARIDRCILDKSVVVGRGAVVGHGSDTTPNRDEPEHLQAGITIVGKAARIPAGARIGRNCCIEAGGGPDGFSSTEIGSGESVRNRADAALF